MRQRTLVALCFLLGHRIIDPFDDYDPCERCGHAGYPRDPGGLPPTRFDLMRLLEERSPRFESAMGRWRAFRARLRRCPECGARGGRWSDECDCLPF